MLVEPFLAPNQLLLEMLWNVLVILTICSLGLFASLALLALACFATQRPDPEECP